MPLSEPTSGSVGDADLLPDLDVTFDIGSSALRWRDIFARRLLAVAGDVNIVDTAGPGGYVPTAIIANQQAAAGSVNEIRSGINGSLPFSQPLFIAGYTYTDNANASAIIDGRGQGSVIFGRSFANYDGAATVECDDQGAFVVGTAFAYGGAADVYSQSRNGTIFGYASTYYGESHVNINNSSYGSLVHGIASSYGAGTQAFIDAGENGQHVGGFARAGYGGGALSALIRGGNNSAGAFVHGSANNVGAGIAQIQVAINSAGAFAQGVADNVATGNAVIAAQDAGAFAQGYAFGGAAQTSQIIASGIGSFARGASVGGNDITASGVGSFAHGYSSTGVITASADNAAQFGPGVNALADSLQIGNGGLRLKGTVGAPGAGVIQDGDIWVAGGYTYRRSNGVSAQF